MDQNKRQQILNTLRNSPGIKIKPDFTTMLAKSMQKPW